MYPMVEFYSVRWQSYVKNRGIDAFVVWCLYNILSNVLDNKWSLSVTKEQTNKSIKY